GGPGYVGPPLIDIDASKAEYYSSGFNLGGDSLIMGVAIRNFGLHAVILTDSQMIACYVGLDATGSQTGANRDSAVLLATNSRLGCDASQQQNLEICAAPNVISGNYADAVEITGPGASIDHTYIGLGPDGTTVIGNGGSGVRVPLLMNGQILGLQI